MQRSCSSPCLSKYRMVEEHDPSKVLEIVGDEALASALKALVSEAVTAIGNGLSPESVEGGLGGAYYFKSCSKVPIAIVKPQDEEPFAPNNPNGYVGKAIGQPGMKRSVRVGEACAREVAAYLLDHGGFARVPKTALVKATHAVFHMNESRQVLPPTKLCSFQQYVEHDYDASDFGTAQFPVAGVHRIGILDIRLYNTDRHAGNILVRCLRNDTARSRRKFSGLREDYCVELTPIDHGYCLPETLDSPYFEWLHWPQAALPFSDAELKYISALDVKAEVSMLRRELPMLREGCLRVLMLSTTFLQRAAAAGFTLYEIGTLMSRELRGYEEEPSEFEKLCAAALVEVRDMSEVTFDADVWSSRASSLMGQSLLEDEDEEGDATDQVEVEDSNEPIQFDMDHDDDSPGSVLSVLESDSMDISTSTGSSMSGLTSSPNTRMDIVSCLITDGGSPLQVEDALDCQYVDKEHVGAAKGAEDSVPGPRSLAVKVPTVCGAKIGFKKDVLRRRGLQPLPPASRSFQGSHWTGGRIAGHKVTSLQGSSQCLLQGSVDLSNLDEETWSLFLDVIVDFIDESLRRYREERSRLSKRLGTSCKF